MRKKQVGFTLIEIAIVLVIIGLLAGGILKGQQMIENAKYKRFKADIDGLMSAVYIYRDRYRYYPGDDPNASPAKRGWADTIPGNGDGIVAWLNVHTVVSEGHLAWQHLKYAQMISGDPSGTTLATGRDVGVNVFGGNVTLGAHNGNFYNFNTRFGMCMSSIPAYAAIRLEDDMDDGNPREGNVRARKTADTSQMATSYTLNDTYTVCLSQ